MKTDEQTRQILVTSALPYANGPIHIGHLLEHIQTDIWVRFQKMRGHTCYCVCADDAHGTPIMLHAEKLGMTPEDLIATIHAAHIADFKGFNIAFDQYHSTHSEENATLVNLIYNSLQEKGYIEQRTIQQAYDPEKAMFLPDRFIRGQCPKCNSADQYGDSCEACGATYAPTDLINPLSALSGATPVAKDSEHYFFKIDRFTEILQQWIDSDSLQAEIRNKLKEWFAEGLKDWDISRDAPYFGFEIPNATGKYFYVWLDAPVGYFASFQKLCARLGLDFQHWCKPNSETEMYHFIGKDIVYFHALFWPAVLHGSGFRKPSAIFAHGFLTINGKKMSKTRGTFITAESYLQHLNPEYLRYYFAAKLGSGIEDIDLNFDDFTQRINADLVGKVVNIASRCAKFIQTRFAGQLSATLPELELQNTFACASESIATCYETREYNKAMRHIMALADKANQYIDSEQPWVIAKDASCNEKLQQVCSMGINLFRLLILYLKPVLPVMAEQAEDFLNIPPLSWSAAYSSLKDHRIKPFTPLMVRVDEKNIQKMMTQSQDNLNSKETKEIMRTDNTEIDIDTLLSVDLRVAKIINCEDIEGADKLLRLTVDLGDLGSRQIFAGIKSAYKAEDLIGRLTVVVANLKPRKMRFGISAGMVLAAGDGDKGIFILSPDTGASPGMRIK